MALIPENIRRKIVDRTKGLLIAGNRWPFIRFAGLRLYDLMRLVIRVRIGSVPGVRSVYLCHGLAVDECYPGLSDFDITVVFDSPDPFEFYPVLRRRWGFLKRYIPIHDLSIVTASEFETWQATGGGWDPIEEIRHWRLIAGEELRHEQIRAPAEAVALDRLAWALGHFQNLLEVSVKEEQRSPHFAVIARRQLYKGFWNTMHALDPEIMSINSRLCRVAKWVEKYGSPTPIPELEAMKRHQFASGPVTTLRFQAAALAYSWLDDTIKRSPILKRKMFRPETQGKSIPVSNRRQVEIRARSICEGIVDIIGDRILSVVLSGTGTARGYSLYIVFRDGLSMSEIADALRDIRAIHRVFDDAWFNEHLPAGLPIVCSPSMFFARLHGGRSSLHFFDEFRCVLYGPDLYAEVVEEAGQEFLPEVHDNQKTDWRRERLLFSINLHQIYFGQLKAALHDYLSFYLPRIVLQCRGEPLPATAEEAVLRFSSLDAEDARNMPGDMLRKYAGRDLDYLLNNMDISVFSESWPLLKQGLYIQDGPG